MRVEYDLEFSLNKSTNLKIQNPYKKTENPIFKIICEWENKLRGSFKEDFRDSIKLINSRRDQEKLQLYSASISVTGYLMP